MADSNIYQSILDSLKVPVVFVDNLHCIRYLNTAGLKQYAKYGDIVGKSIFSCHNSDSTQKIKDIFGQLQSGAAEVIYSDNEKQRIYMRAVRDGSGKVLGYYERFEDRPAI